jgi:hypothetical protein
VEINTGEWRNVGSRRDAWIDKVKQGAEPDADGWLRVRGLTLAEAQQLLDWLDNQGIAHHELVFDPTAGFTVRWRLAPDVPPPGTQPP